MKTAKTEYIRLKYKYRTLIIKGKIRLALKSAIKFIGPDCAYHLYKRIDKNNKSLAN
jgi:hypothetical protein